MTEKPKRVVIWCRVSAEEQATEGKASIPDQLARQRARAEANGWQVVDTLVIDGHSGRYWTYLEFSQDAVRHGFTDANKMWAHWDARDFDILSCRDISRLGREQSIISEFVGRTITAGAIVAPLDEATLDITNHRFGSAFGGIGASQHVDNLIRYHEMGMLARAAQGRKIGSRPPPFYIEVRDPANHKPLGIKPDREKYQRLFDDFVTVYCKERRSYEQIGIRLYEGFGHVNPKTNKPYTKYPFLNMLYNAATWGHLAYGRYRPKEKRFGGWGYWITGDAPPPDEVKFFANVVEPIWQSPVMERVKAEFNHRHVNMVGTMVNRTKYLLSGLCKCALCGSGMASYTNRDGRRYYRCSGRYGGLRNNCENKLLVPQVEIVEWLSPIVERWQQGQEAPPAIAPANETQRVRLIEQEIAEARSEIKRLLATVGKYGDTADAIAGEEIKQHEARIKILDHERLQSVSTDAALIHQAITQQDTLNKLRQITMAEFWQQEDYTVNQWLHRLLGRTRIVILHRYDLHLVTPVN